MLQKNIWVATCNTHTLQIETNFIVNLPRHFHSSVTNIRKKERHIFICYIWFVCVLLRFGEYYYKNTYSILYKYSVCAK